MESETRRSDPVVKPREAEEREWFNIQTKGDIEREKILKLQSDRGVKQKKKGDLL